MIKVLNFSDVITNSSSEVFCTITGKKIDSFPQESYSKNIILNRRVIITPSSFNLKPIKEIIV